MENSGSTNERLKFTGVRWKRNLSDLGRFTSENRIKNQTMAMFKGAWFEFLKAKRTN